MEELIKNIILESDEDTGFIGDAIEIGNVALELLEDGIEFDLDFEEIDELIDDNDILQFSKTVCEDCGKVRYFLEEVFDEEGYTIPDELETLYIDSDLIDCVDLEAFGDTEIILVEVSYEEDEDFECDGDCENCTLQEDEFEDEDLGFVLTQELLDTLSEVDSDDVESIVELIVDKLNEAFAMGYQEGLDDAKSELVEAIDAIDSLK